MAYEVLSAEDLARLDRPGHQGAAPPANAREFEVAFNTGGVSLLDENERAFDEPRDLLVKLAEPRGSTDR